MKFKTFKPNNTPEKIILISLVLSLFSGWPRLHLGETATLEPIMLGWLIGSIGLLSYTYKNIFTKKYFTLPWMLLFIWFLLGSITGLIFTNNITTTVLQILFLASAGVFGVSLYIVLIRKLVRLDWLINMWITLAVVTAGFSILQFLLVAFWGIPILSEAYQVGVFEFPRIHMFAQEPLYYANWILVPLLIRFVRKESFTINSVLFTSLFLTLARGAFVSVIFVAPFLYYLFLRHKPNKDNIERGKVIIVAGAITLIFVGVSTTLNSDKTFMSGVGRYLDHASLGVFNKEGATNIEPTKVNNNDSGEEKQSSPQVSTKTKESFVVVEGIDDQGVVEASTLGRLEAIRVALDVFNDSPQNMIFGVGLYQFGESANDKDPDLYSEKLITNNQYVQVLVETGILGFILYFGAIAYTLVISVKKQYSILRWAMVALLIQYFFFSSYTLFPFWLVFALLLSQANIKRTFIWQRKNNG